MLLLVPLDVCLLFEALLTTLTPSIVLCHTLRLLCLTLSFLLMRAAHSNISLKANLAQNPPTEATVLRGLAAPFFDFCFFASNTTIGSSYNLKRLLLHGRIELLAALLSSLSVSA